MSLPNKKYDIILADPPWRYDDKGCEGAAEKHYPTMSLNELKNLPVSSLASENCALFIWVTYPMLKEGLEVIEAWGFKYKTIAFQWVKKNPKATGYFFGLGRWTRGNTEPCLLAVKGKPKRVANDVSQLIISPVKRHSEKPTQQYVLIERLLGNLPQVELFCRNRRDGWDSWGNQVSETIQKSLEKAGEP